MTRRTDDSRRRVPTVECPCEQEVLAAVLGGRWPDGCDEELRMHVNRCAICGDVATVAALLQDDHQASRRDVHVPAAGQVWWRAAVRARLEASQSAARPITWLHGLTGASTAGLAFAVMGIAWPSIREGFSWAGGHISRLDPEAVQVAGYFADVVQRSLPVAVGIAACLVLAPIALYFALSDE